MGKKVTSASLADATAPFSARKLQTGKHKMPADLKKALASSLPAQQAWEGITPLARNEFICWVLDAKKPETRTRRIKRTQEELEGGKRRPCCWAGCPHRTK